MDFFILALWFTVGSGVLYLVTSHAYLLWKVYNGGLDDHSLRDVVVVQSGNTERTEIGKVDLKKLPCFEYKCEEEKSNGLADMDCVVCLESFKMGDQCKKLPTCNHSFHVQCIDSWLMKTPHCPICRTFANSQWIDEQSNVDSRALQ